MWLLIRLTRLRKRLAAGRTEEIDVEPADELDDDATDSDEDIEAELLAEAEDLDEAVSPRPSDGRGVGGEGFAVEGEGAGAEAIAPIPAVEEEPDDEAIEAELAELAEAAQADEAEEEAAEGVVEEAPKLSLFQRLKQGLAKTAGGLVGKIDAILTGRSKIDEDLYADLEEALITADLGVQTAFSLLENARKLVKERKIEDMDGLRTVLKELILDIMKTEAIPLETSGAKPFVIMVVGVNGVGKTTTIGKMAAQFTREGKKVIMAAGDTFRAAAIEQLEIWSQRVGCEIIKQASGADPSAVAFDAVQAAVARGADVVLVDTAGRLHTKSNLMEELKKTKRVMGKIVPDAPHETVLVLDSTTGQNAIQQAKTFNEAIDLTGLILTKLDGTSKGGCIVGICDELNVPIRFIGIGEKIDDLRPFDAVEFVDALFEKGV
ncbi:MAG: signal recognition particle-docking protein FtsY [Deltaproteobacteria bacterium]|nr:signal recognition particle-docking protein FtsY [Deltaproteobacteria bacterium]